MKYNVYMRAENSVVNVAIESEEEPIIDGNDIMIGKSRLQRSQVMAVIPEEQDRGGKMLVAGRG